MSVTKIRKKIRKPLINNHLNKNASPVCCTGEASYRRVYSSVIRNYFALCMIICFGKSTIKHYKFV